MQFYILRDNRITGPFDKRQLLEWRKSGIIADNDLVRSAGVEGWTRLGTIIKDLSRQDFTLDKPATGIDNPEIQTTAGTGSRTDKLLTSKPRPPGGGHISMRKLLVIVIFAGLLLGMFFASLWQQSRQAPMPTASPLSNTSPANPSQTAAVSSSVEPASQSQVESQNAADVHEIKALRPQLKEVLSYVDAYSKALSGLVPNIRQIFTNLDNARTNPEVVQAFQNEPERAKAIWEEECNRYYDMFQKAIRNILEITEDEEVPHHLTATSQAIAAHPHSSMKTILMDAVEKCRKAQRTLENYRRRGRSDLTDKMNQMASAVQELDSQFQDLQAEAQLLQASDEALEKQ